MPRPSDPRPLQRVLVATDFSPAAQNALARVTRLPLGTGSSLELLHVLPRGLEAALRTREQAEARHRLERAATSLAKAFRARKVRGVEVRTASISGEPFLEIIRHAQATRAELVVLGRHGKRQFRDLLLGSTAERVIHKGSTPVLIVGSTARGPYRRPVVAMDLSDASRRALTLAERLVSPSARKLHIVHAYETPHARVLGRVTIAPDLASYYRECRDSARRALTKLLETVPVTPVTRVVLLHRGDARKVILAAAARERADLIAVATHGRTGLPQVLVGSVAEAVIRHASCDVVVARPERFSFVHPLDR